MKMNSIKASFMDVACENDYLWIFDNLIQAVCRIRIDSFEMEIVACYKGKEQFVARRIFLFEDKIYLTTGDSIKVLVFERKKQGKCSEFSLQESVICEGAKAYITFLYGSCIYFFPRYIDNEVIGFEIRTGKYFKRDLFQDLSKRQLENGGLRIRYPGCYKGNVYFTLDNTKCYVICNLEDESVTAFQAEHTYSPLNSCCFDGERVWTIESSSNSLFCMEKEVVISRSQTYSRICPTEKWIVILPEEGDKLVFVRKDTFDVSMIKLPLQEKEMQHVKLDCCENDKLFIFFSRKTCSLFLIDKESLEIRCCNLKCENYLEKCLEAEKILINEAEHKSLHFLLNICGRVSNSSFIPEEFITETGGAIWKAIK